jgi:preprotein translocase subunit YajC
LNLPYYDGEFNYIVGGGCGTEVMTSGGLEGRIVSFAVLAGTGVGVGIVDSVITVETEGS